MRVSLCVIVEIRPNYGQNYVVDLSLQGHMRLSEHMAMITLSRACV